MQRTPANIHPVSWCSIPIRLIGYEPEAVLAVATAFLYLHKDQTYLITNWHNVTGFNPLTGARLSNYQASPTTIHMPLRVNKDNVAQWKQYNLPIYGEEEPLWFIHPSHGNRVDVVAVPLNGIDDVISPPKLHHINSVDFDSDVKAEVSNDAFVVGFPEGLNSGGNFPLWKRATIASEPDIDIDKLPKVLIDTASRKGMSGSPVIYTRQNYFKTDEDGKMSGDSIFGQVSGFLGVYSGRVNTQSEIDTQIGIVWKREVIEEIIEGEVKDTGYYPNTEELLLNKVVKIKV